ncbi:hypothetical protein PSHT_00396 [Puccinia striiformis]|uniref:POT family proton-dependent oligopeptide transporter n=1 Tax=Puccinia striiformis TaxID=27350 RepID=A0A2S4WN30_9BASI|nr:hypothetical protein PSHT_00396 [Puccinia striiformis]
MSVCLGFKNRFGQSFRGFLRAFPYAHAQPVAYNAIHPSRLKSLPTPQPDHPDVEKLKAPGFDLPPPAFGDPMIYPSTEEFATLRKVPGKIFLNTYLIAFVEFAERFSYYGTTVVFTNFIQRPLPPGSTTGAGGLQAGALGLGQQAATGITTFNSFWVYLCPLFGAYVADAHLGRYNTIIISIFIALIGHTLLVISAIPTVIVHPSGSTACFLVAIIIMGIGTGGFKPNISPLVAEQADTNNQKPYIKVLPKTNEKVIVDPTLTAGRIYMYFYLMINVGALTGQIGMVYAEKYVGFWLAYLLPTVLFCTCPLVMILGKPLYVLRPPTGSVFGKALKLMKFATIKKFQASRKSPQQPIGFWEAVKPSNLAGQKPTWMNFDDHGLTRLGELLVDIQSDEQQLDFSSRSDGHSGTAKRYNSNLDPFALIILIPICDLLIYPALRRAGINFSPIKRITAGFITGALAMGWAAIIQHWIYQRSTCGNMAGRLLTGLEYAFTLAPKNMRSLVTALFLFQSAIASALGEAFVPLSADPLLVWNYGTMGVIAFVAGIAFHFFHRSIDREHEYLIRLQEGTVPDGKNVLDPKDAENNQIIIHNSDNHHQDQHDEHDHDHDHEPNLVMGEHEASKHS